MGSQVSLLPGCSKSQPSIPPDLCSIHRLLAASAGDTAGSDHELLFDVPATLRTSCRNNSIQTRNYILFGQFVSITLLEEQLVHDYSWGFSKFVRANPGRESGRFGPKPWRLREPCKARVTIHWSCEGTRYVATCVSVALIYHGTR
jgi:hypothetical protein